MLKLFALIYSILSSIVFLYFSHLNTRLIKGISKANVLLIIAFLLSVVYNDIKTKAIIKYWCLFAIGFFIAYTLLTIFCSFASPGNQEHMLAVYEATNYFIIFWAVIFGAFTLYSFTLKK
jgi:hypothetical protein